MSAELSVIVKQYRAAERARRNLTGSHMGTRRARQGYGARIDSLDSTLRDLPHGRGHLLRGLLEEEAVLLDRLRGVPRGERPELRQRLLEVRREIKKEATA